MCMYVHVCARETKWEHKKERNKEIDCTHQAENSPAGEEPGPADHPPYAHTHAQVGLQITEYSMRKVYKNAQTQMQDGRKQVEEESRKRRGRPIENYW